MFSKSFTATLFALSVASSVSATCTRSYTVKAGDICDSISAANNVSTYQLATVNFGHIDPECSNLLIGDNICLGHDGQDCTSTYVVKLDDTCEQISAITGVNTTTLYLNNPQINAGCTNIYVGEVLCAASGLQAPPPPVGADIPAATIPATATPAPPSTKPTPAPAPAAPAPAAPAPQDNNDEDDDDLPFCDEL